MVYLITILLILVLLVLILFLLLSIYPLKAEAVFSSEQQIEMHVLLSWLNPFLKATVTRDNNQLKLTVYIFNSRLFRKNLTSKNTDENKGKKRSFHDYIDYARALDLHHVKLYAFYGFEDPSVTGMLCGGIDLISQAIVVEDFYNNADFVTDHDYFNIQASAEINAAVSLINALRRRSANFRVHAYSGSK